MTNSTFFLIYHDISSNSHYPAELHVITPIYIMRKPQHLSSITTYRICRWLQIYSILHLDRYKIQCYTVSVIDFCAYPIWEYRSF